MEDRRAADVHRSRKSAGKRQVLRACGPQRKANHPWEVCNVIRPVPTELVIDDCRIRITSLEFALFQYLRAQPGKAVAREALIRHVWGYQYNVGSNVVEAVIKSLRKKLGNRSEMIETVPGYGYKLRSSA